ncbi:MAG: oxidoreductase [Chitinophagaceae bacterium]|nr:MAG: oxidoreductase [Chitinophagaceae bacterium]
MKNTLLLTLCLLLFVTSRSQDPRLLVLSTGNPSSLRGLCVVNDNVVWASGSHGMIGRSTNAGKNWKWTVVKGFEKTEFRDIEAFDANVAIIMAVGEPAYILKTIDGGESWKVVYQNDTKGMFLDAMDFSNNQDGLVIGDPLNGHFFMARTSNSGNTWEEMTGTPIADSGEAFFAASGSNLRFFTNEDYLLVSGGLQSNLVSATTKKPLQLLKGMESTGANSIDVFDNGDPDKPGKRMIIVGGDFSKPDSTKGNCIYTTNAGKTWKKPTIPPTGYRSSVEYLSNKIVLACGINGVDISEDAGKTWRRISPEGFNTCRIAKIGRAVYLAGNKGKIARLEWPAER